MQCLEEISTILRKYKLIGKTSLLQEIKTLFGDTVEKHIKAKVEEGKL